MDDDRPNPIPFLFVPEIDGETWVYRCEATPLFAAWAVRCEPLSPDAPPLPSWTGGGTWDALSAHRRPPLTRTG